MTKDLLQKCDDLFDQAKAEATKEMLGPITFDNLNQHALALCGLFDTPTALYVAGFNDGWHHLRYLLRAALDEQVAQ